MVSAASNSIRPCRLLSNDRIGLSLYTRRSTKAGAIALFHTGQTGVGSACREAWGCG